MAKNVNVQERRCASKQNNQQSQLEKNNVLLKITIVTAIITNSKQQSKKVQQMQLFTMGYKGVGGMACQQQAHFWSPMPWYSRKQFLLETRQSDTLHLEQYMGVFMSLIL